MTGKFSITINLSHHQMVSKDNLQNALCDLGYYLSRPDIQLKDGSEEKIFDNAGNNVGSWEFTKE